MNSQWQIDLFTGLNNVVDMQDILDSTLKITKKFGFDYVGWRTELPLPMISQNKTLAFSTVEDNVMKKVMDGYYDDMPVPKHCAKTMEPISWFGTRNDWLYNIKPEMCEDYYSNGRFGGWAQSLIENKKIFSLFWVDTSAPVSQKDINHVSFEMEWIATSVLIKMNQIRQVSDIKLSEREKEILKWSGDGKTADEIGQILTLSHSTINFHLRKAMFKLNAPNKTSAVVKAIYLNLLY